jgi:hypothetical protein
MAPHGPQSTIFHSAEARDDALSRLRARPLRTMHLRSLVAIKPSTGAMLYTPPALARNGYRDVVMDQAARDAGWKPCYWIIVRPKQ